MSYTNFRSNINQNIANALHEESYLSATFQDAERILSHFYTGKGVSGAHRIDRGNKGIVAWLTDGCSGDKSIVLHIKDFKNGGLVKSKNVWLGDYPAVPPTPEPLYDNSFAGNYLECFVGTDLIEGDDSIGGKWDKGVKGKYASLVGGVVDRLECSQALLKSLFDFEEGCVSVAIKKVLPDLDNIFKDRVVLLAKFLSVPELVFGRKTILKDTVFYTFPEVNEDKCLEVCKLGNEYKECFNLCYNWKKFNQGSCNTSDGLARGLCVVYGDVLTDKRVILCEGLFTALTARSVFEKELSEPGYEVFKDTCVIFTRGDAGIPAVIKALQVIRPNIQIFVMHEEGAKWRDVVGPEIISLPAMFPAKNWDWNDDLLHLIKLNRQERELGLEGIPDKWVGEGVCNKLSNFIASHLNEHAREVVNLEDLRDLIENDPEAPNVPLTIDDTLDISKLPQCLQNILGPNGSDMFKGDRAHCGLLLLLCCIGGLVGGRVRVLDNGVYKRIFLYGINIAESGSGKTRRRETFEDNVSRKFKDHFFDISQTYNTNKLFIKINFDPDFKKQPDGQKIIDKILEQRAEGDKNSSSYLYEIRRSTKKHFERNVDQISNNSSKRNQSESLICNEEEDMEKAIYKKLSNSFSDMFVEKRLMDASSQNSIQVVKKTFLFSTSSCFIFDEMRDVLIAENKGSTRVSQEIKNFLVQNYGSNGGLVTESATSVNIRTESPALFCLGNIPTDAFMRYIRMDSGKADMSDGFLARNLLCSDPSAPIHEADKLLTSVEGRKSEISDGTIFRDLLLALINIEDRFYNPVEFLHGHINVELPEYRLEDARDLMSELETQFCEVAAMFGVGDELKPFFCSRKSRIAQTYKNVYGLMCLLLAGEESLKEPIEQYPTKEELAFCETTFIKLTEQNNHTLENLFSYRDGLQRFITKSVKERAVDATIAAVRGLMGRDLAIRKKHALEAKPQLSPDFMSAQHIYKHVQDLEKGVLPIGREIKFVLSNGKRIKTYAFSTSELVKCPWFFASTDGNRDDKVRCAGNTSLVKTYLERNIIKKDAIELEDKDLITSSEYLRYCSCDADATDVESKLFIKIHSSGRNKAINGNRFVFNFFNKDLIERAFCLPFGFSSPYQQ